MNASTANPPLPPRPHKKPLLENKDTETNNENPPPLPPRAKKQVNKDSSVNNNNSNNHNHVNNNKVDNSAPKVVVNVKRGAPEGKGVPQSQGKIHNHHSHAAATELDKRSFKKLRCVVLGDTKVGKTSLILRFINQKYTADYKPTIFETYKTNTQFGPWSVALKFWEVAGSDAYATRRPVCYPKADAFIICFDLSSTESFEAARRKWIEELQSQGKAQHPLVFVGTKKDISQGQQQSVVKNQMADEDVEEKYLLFPSEREGGGKR